jgi:diaminopimelate decarboxylase
VQMHIGSQLTSVEPFSQAVAKVVSLVMELKEKYGLEFFSIGGGIGIVYKDSLASGSTAWWDEKRRAGEPVPLTIETYAERLLPMLKPLGMRILLEPGRPHPPHFI